MILKELAEMTELMEMTQDDNHAADELYMFIKNDGNLYNRWLVPIRKNLSKKWKKGSYNPELAVKAYIPLTAESAKKYAKEIEGVEPSRGLKMFSPSVRREVAKTLEQHWRHEMELGNFQD